MTALLNQTEPATADLAPSQDSRLERLLSRLESRRRPAARRGSMPHDSDISLTAIDTIDEAGSAIRHISDRLLVVANQTADEAVSIVRTWPTFYAVSSAAGVMVAMLLLKASPVLWCLAAVPMAIGWMPSAQRAQGRWYGATILIVTAVLLAMVLAPTLRLATDGELPVDPAMILGAFLVAGLGSFTCAAPMARLCYPAMRDTDRSGLVLGYRLIGLQTVIISLAAAP